MGCCSLQARSNSGRRGPNGISWQTGIAEGAVLRSIGCLYKQDKISATGWVSAQTLASPAINASSKPSFRIAKIRNRNPESETPEDS